MGGFANDILGNTIVWADNVDFSGNVVQTRAITTNGQLLIGSTAAPNIRSGTLTSSDSSLTITNGPGTISLTVTGGSTVGKTITGDSGGALSPTAGNWNLLGSGSITTSGAGSTLTTQLTGLTNHAVLVGAGTATITKLAIGSTGQVLQANSAADPTWSTATFPSTATSTGTILRADGTNWVATTATYPATTSINQILYSSAANVVGGITYGTTNQILVATTSAAPSYKSFSVKNQVFTSTGTYTPTAGMIYCNVICLGGGGAGGGTAATGVATVALGGGGGAGEYAAGAFSASSIGGSQAVTIGAGGTGVSGATGNVGGTTSLGALVTAIGGGGGIGGGAGTSAATSGGGGGTGGTGGDFHAIGNYGFYGWGNANFQISGLGGSTYLGQGQQQIINSSQSGSAAPATGYGCGGNGACAGFSQSAFTGGAGSKGIIIVTEYIIS